jgi:hypothetical protein
VLADVVRGVLEPVSRLLGRLLDLRRGVLRLALDLSARPSATSFSSPVALPTASSALPLSLSSPALSLSPTPIVFTFRSDGTESLR